MSAAAAIAEEHFTPEAPARGLFEGAGTEHYREHAAQIRQWRNEGARH